MPAGSKLFYTTASKQTAGKAERGRARLLEFWVTRQGADSSAHVILRSSTTEYRVTEDGKRTESKPGIGWAYCDIYPDGRVADNSSLGDIDPKPLFVPLPADTVAAKQGWDRLDTAREESYHHRLDNKTLTDSIWLIREGVETPLDAAYQLSRSALVYLDTRRGLPVLRESKGTQAAGAGAGEATGTSKLDSVVRFDTVKARPLLTDLETYFRADSAYTALVDRADADSLDRLLAQAETVLMDARLRVADTSLQGLIEDALVRHGRIAEYYRHEAESKPALEGKPAPDWQLEDFAGKRQTLKGFCGKVVLLDFWYVDCPWCMRAMPKLNALAERFRGKPVAVLGMNTDDSIAAAREVLERMKITYPSLKAKDVYKQYGVTGFPTLFVIDKKGVVRRVHVGYSKDMEETLAATVEQLLSGK